MEFFDSHSHYNDEKFNEDREKIIKDTFESGITKFVCAGYNIPSSLFSLELSKKYEYIYSICGISPNDIPQSEQELWKSIDEIIQIVKEKNSKKLVAIGEIGLDYYWNKENSDLQKQAFIKQIELANEMKLPIVIHSRDASVDTIDIIRNHRVKKAGIFHCCQLNQELVRQALELGYYISFAGPITFKNSKNAPDVVKMVPLDRILIETDSPYLSPEPNRGKRNDCRNVKYVAQKIADIKEISLEEVAKKTYENAMRIFEI
ncbi:hydrolase TatD family [Clostridium sp. CAG:356]|mgnify:FL=1|nr:hydrolase TatD family [Clostridium sp. CAG:356]